MFARGRTCGCGGRKGRRGVSLPWRWKSPTVYRHSSPGPHSWSVAGPTRRAERPGRAHTRGAVNRPKSASQQTPTVRTQTTPEGDLKGWHEDRSRRNPLTWRQEGWGTDKHRWDTLRHLCHQILMLKMPKTAQRWTIPVIRFFLLKKKFKLLMFEEWMNAWTNLNLFSFELFSLTYRRVRSSFFLPCDSIFLF